MTWIAAAQKAFRCCIANTHVDRLPATVWYGKKQEQRGGQDTSRNSRINSKGIGNGRQEQRSRCDVAEHDWRDGKGIQFLRQPGHVVARILQGDEPGRRRYRGRAEAAWRDDGKVSRQHE